MWHTCTNNNSWFKIKMSDLLDEVSIDIKEERYSNIVKKITRVFIIGAVSTIIAVGIYIWKENSTKKIQVELGLAFHAALMESENNNLDKAIALYDKVIANPNMQYSALAYLNKSQLLLKQNNVKAAQECLKTMIEQKNLDKALRELAEIVYLGNKLSYNIDFDKDDELMLNKLAGKDHAWHLTSLQINALNQIKNNKIEEAKVSLGEIIKSKEATRASFDTASSILTTISNKK
jgi:hypothetical protein